MKHRFCFEVVCAALIAGVAVGCEVDCADGSKPNEECACADGSKAKSCDAGGGAESTANTVASEDFESAGFDAGDWEVDNLHGVHGDGKVAVHPPELKAGDTATLTFACDGKAHTQIRFWLTQPENLGEQYNLDFFVDGASVARAALGSGNYGFGWKEVIVNVPRGEHTYAFTARSEIDRVKTFVIDDFTCRDVEPKPADNQRVSFDDGFVPLEVAEAWDVDNIHGKNAGEAAIHPPALKAGDTFDMRFDCGGAEHTQLRFWLTQPANLGEKYDLDFFVDEVERARDTLGSGSYGFGWKEVVINVPQGTHVYRFSARAEIDIAAPFLIDGFHCVTDAPPGPGANGFVNFDEGYVPLEVEGAWLVDNARGAQAGEAAAHPPILSAGERAGMSLRCDDPNHSELTFWLKQPGNLGERYNLEFAIDDGEPTLIGSGNYGFEWTEKRIVPDQPGHHTYTFTAFTEIDLRTTFVVDSFRCR